ISLARVSKTPFFPIFAHGYPSLFKDIATIMHEVESEKIALESDPTKLKVFFQETIQMCL
ncbi:MAG: hypothetical protein NXY57DRAFT_1023164, partial [Lentinula lateritia]